MQSVNPRRRNTSALNFEQLEPRLAMAVVINEFMALNTSGIQDQDGDRTDWIELRNTDGAAVNLAGWHLTDDAGDLDKWTLPSVTIPGNGYLLVYASGKNRAVANQQLHTNFQLATEGEYLGLVMPDGATVADSYNPYPEQLADISYGRGSGGTVTELPVGEQQPVRVFVPTGASAIDTTWYTLGFNDSTWISGVGGVGFDNDSDATNLNPFVDVNVGAQMDLLRNTAYIRMPFQLADPTAIANLRLKIRYEDGFGVYLNGTRITSAGRSSPASLAWNSAATASRNPQSAAATYEVIDITAFKNLLLAGNNVLAIHGLNRNTTSRDFLIDALLETDRSLPGQLGYMTAPTPNGANQQGTQGFVADTKFSVNRGFFTSPFPVTITTATAGAQIRYTTDGRVPTATTGTVYNPASPPVITTTTTLRAAAFKVGFTPTNVDTQTYIFLNDVIDQDGVGLPAYAPWGNNLASPIPDWEMDPQVVNNPTYASTIINDLKAIPTVSLVMPWNDWFGGAGVGIYPTQSELERGTSVEFFDAAGNYNFQVDAGIEIQGGTSDDRWKTDKLSMRIKFQEAYGPTKFEADIFNHPLFDLNAATEFDTLILDAQINYSWPYGGTSSPLDQRSRAMYVQDQFAADLQNLAGGYAPHGVWTHLYINGLYWGLYNVKERPDDSFAESYLGGDKDDYDVIKHNATTEVSGGSTAIANYAAMLNLTRQNMSVLANYQAAAAKIDVESLATYMALNYYVGNDDWAHHNWYATYNRVEPGSKWQYHSWDAEHILKSVSYNAIATGSFGGSPEEVHLNLMGSEEYRLKFSDAVEKHMRNNGVMTPQQAAAIYQARVNEIDRAIVGESARWGDNRTTGSEPPGAGNAYTRDHFIARVTDLMTNYFPFRTGVVISQFTGRDWLVSLAAPTLTQYGGTVAAGYQLTIAKPAGAPAGSVLYYTLDGSDPRLPGGGISPTAVAIAGNSTVVTINAGVKVRTRVFSSAQAGTRDDWSPEIAATFLLETPFPLRITELNYHPAEFAGVADAENLEFIELTNTGSQPISLNGVRITQFSGDGYTFANGQSLAAGARIIVARNPTIFTQAYGSGLNVAALGYADANLSNGGERVVLLGPLGETLQDFMFQDGGGWPTAADGGGKSLEIIDPLGDPTSASNWRASFSTGGSPGAAGGQPAFAGDFDGDAKVSGNDFLAWQRGVGLPALQGSQAKGDADGDRDVDAIDLGMWRNTYGSATVAAAQAEIAAAAVLEDDILKDGEWILLDAPAVRTQPPRTVRERWVDAVFDELSSRRDDGFAGFGVRRSVWTSLTAPDRADDAGAADDEFAALADFAAGEALGL